MSQATIYGIKNCDTMKKAFTFLESHRIAYGFHDYKKHGVDLTILQEAMTQHGWEQVINRKGTSWRKLPDGLKETMDETGALKAAEENPSLIKRPLLVYQNQIFLGFNELKYTEIFGV